MLEERELYHSFVKLFIDAISSFSMYPEKHPIVEGALASLISILEKIFKLQDKDLEIFIKGRNLLVNGIVLDISKTFVTNFLNYMMKLELSNFTVRRSCTKDDISDLVSFFAENARRQGGAGGLLNPQGSAPFSLPDTKNKERIYEEPLDERKPISFEVLEKLFRAGEEALEGFIAFDEVELIEFIRRNPEKTADIMIEAAKYTGSIHLVWQRLGDWLIKAIRKVGFRLENVNFSNLVYALGEILAARMRLIYTEKEASENLSLFYMAVSEYKDRLKVMEIVSKIDSDEKLDFANIAKLSIETFESQEEKEKLLPLIKEELKTHGWGGNKIENLLGYIGNVFIPVRPKESSGGVFVSSSQALASDTLGGVSLPESRKEDLPLLEEVKKSYRDLERKFQRLDKIIRKLAVGMIVVDSENKIILTNKRAEEILGASLEDMKGKSISKMLKSGNLLLLVQRSEDKSLEEAVFVAPEKMTEETISSSWAVVEDENGESLGLLCIVPELNKIKELERIKSELIANVHDRLLKPLSASLDMVRILLEEVSGTINEEQKRVLEDIQSNLEYIHEDLSKILKLNEIRNAKEFSSEKVNIYDLLKEVHSFFKVVFARKNINLELKINTKNKYVVADRQRTKDILQEILTNAFKASKSGSSVMLICEDEFDSKGNMAPFIRIRIRDQGMGIAREDIGHLSEDFFTRGPRGLKGLGLGLSLVKEIVEKQGGVLNIDSSLGKGAEVSFTLPKSK